MRCARAGSPSSVLPPDLTLAPFRSRIESMSARRQPDRRRPEVMFAQRAVARLFPDARHEQPAGRVLDAAAADVARTPVDVDLRAKPLSAVVDEQPRPRRVAHPKRTVDVRG